MKWFLSMLNQKSEKMIDIGDLVESITDINKNLFGELLDEHLQLEKAYYRRDYEKVLIKGGKFVETVFQILEQMVTGSYSTQPKFMSIQKSLEKSSTTRYPSSIRMTIPRAARIIYEMRSHRGGAHKSEVNPQFLDAKVCLNIASWIVCEFIRLYSDKEPENVEQTISQMISRRLPFIEEFEDGDVMLLIDPSSCKEECLLYLYHFYPKRISNEQMREYLDHQTAQNVLTSLSRAELERLVHRNDNGNKLTQKGKLYIEDKYGPELDENTVLSQ